MNYLEKHPLAAVREKAGLNKNQLAKKLGKNNGYLTMVEQGKRPLSYETCMQIEKITGCDGDFLHFEVYAAQIAIANVQLMNKAGITVADIDFPQLISALTDLAEARHKCGKAEYYSNINIAKGLADGSLLLKKEA